jgi:hypothetical protein
VRRRTTQGSGVRGRRARRSSGRKHARPCIPCSRLSGRAYACASIASASSINAPPRSRASFATAFSQPGGSERYDEADVLSREILKDRFGAL